MTERRPYAAALECLRAAGLRSTRQRLALTRLLFADTDRHVTAEALHKEAQANNVRVSLATVYNTLNGCESRMAVMSAAWFVEFRQRLPWLLHVD